MLFVSNMVALLELKGASLCLKASWHTQRCIKGPLLRAYVATVNGNQLLTTRVLAQQEFWHAGIVAMQLALTTVVCVMFMSHDLLRQYLMKNQWPIWTSMAGSLATMMAMVCNPQITRSFPMNYGLLGVFTLFQSVMVGFVCMVCFWTLLDACTL